MEASAWRCASRSSGVVVAIDLALVLTGLLPWWPLPIALGYYATDVFFDRLELQRRRQYLDRRLALRRKLRRG